MGLRKYVFALQFVIQCLQLPFCIWAKHILVTSSSIFGDSSRNGEAGGCCQQHRYISVVVMYGRSSVSLLSSPSGCRSACLDDFATFIFSGVSLFRRSRWHGDVPPVSSFWGVTLEDFPLDLCIFASNKFNFLGRIFLQVTSVKQKPWEDRTSKKITEKRWVSQSYLFCTFPLDLTWLCGLSPKSDSQKSSLSGTHLSSGWKSFLSRGSLLNNCKRRSIRSIRASNCFKAGQIH